MKSYHEYWSFTAVRGVLALLAAIVVIAVPRAAADLFVIPILLAFAIGALALWSVFDSAFTALLAFLIPTQTLRRSVLLPQAVIAFLLAALLFLNGYRLLPAGALVWIVALQAASFAAAEFFVARTTHRTYDCLSCYTTVFAFAFSALALPFASALSPANMTLALAAYLSLIGISELGMGSRMLFLGYRRDHPALRSLAQDWQASTELALGKSIAQPAPTACAPDLTCGACPATSVCRDNALSTQITGILHNHQPAIVNSVRAATLLAHH